MKKLIIGLFSICLAISLYACSSGNNAEKTQEKIEKAGWTIDLQRDAGTAVDYLKIIVNEYEYFSFTRMKEDDSINHVEYLNGHEFDKYNIAYNIETKEETLLHNQTHLGETKTTCLGYNLTKSTIDNTLGTEGKCSKDELDYFNIIKDIRDSELKRNDITLDDLYDWAVWYYKNK